MDRELLPSPRFREQISLSARTFGLREGYDLMTLDISKSGLLTVSKNHLPFQINTLLEITIDPLSKVFKQPISCIGKVIRIATENRPEKIIYPSMLGIVIPENMDMTQQDWYRYLDELEQTV